MPKTKRKQRPQPKDLKTGQRLATTARAVGQGISAALRGKHETQKGRRHLVSEAKLKSILKDWPAPQKNIADQMVAKYGLPNEATTTKLFWYNNGPWKRTELSRDIVLHHWPTVHTDFLTQVIDYRVPPKMFHLIAEFDGSILTFIDLDIDVLVAPDFSRRILDEDEFATHALLYHYPAAVRDTVPRALAELNASIERRDFPFDWIA